MSASIVSAAAVSFEYRDRTILEDITLRIHAGDRIALIGANGSGKSTLLRLLAGYETPASGSIQAHGGARLAWLPQISESAADQTVGESLAERIGVGPAERELDRLTALLAAGDLEAIEAHALAIERWTALGGADFDARIGPALETFGIDPTWSARPQSSLSGGQHARVSLAALQLARLDCALLDEPSNHLDHEGLELLEATIRDAPFAIVFASHDRTLLERVAADVFELNRTRGRLYRGGWSAYEREREAARRGAELEYEEAVTERDRLVRLERQIRQQGEVGERRARRSTETDKHIRYMSIQSAQKNTAASGIGKRISDIEIPDKPWRENLSQLLLDRDQPVHSPAVVTLRDVVLTRGSWQSAPASLTIAPGERILLSGPNGSGKSSLIAALAGRIRPDSGEIERPAKVQVTELAQVGNAFANTGVTLIQNFRELSGLGETAARTALAAMRLGPELVVQKPTRLSPGELTRAELALLAHRPAACLLLDEPSNHLDIEALDVLEAALKGWKGALVLASHDRVMRDRIKIDREINLSTMS